MQCRMCLVCLYSSGRNQRGRSRSRSRSTTPDLSSIETTGGGGGGDGEKGEKGKKRDAPSGGKVDGGIPPPPTKKQRCKDYDGKQRNRMVEWLVCGKADNKCKKKIMLN